MKNITTNIPDTLLRQAQTIAEREELSLDQFIALALASQISVWDTRASFAARAKHGDWQNAQEVLAKAPNNEPEAHDQF